MRALKILIAALLLPCSSLVLATTPFDGEWFGAIEVPNQPLEVEIEFSSDSEGGLSGLISIPSQGLLNAPLDGIERDGDNIRFAIPGIPGGPTFDGARVDDTSITGTFSQGGAELAFALKRENPADAAREALGGLDAEIEKALADFNVPGLGITIVAGGEVVYARGFGYRDLDEALPMNPDTLFAIGSTTKAMTTAVLGMLTDEGLFNWDEPVRTYLPAFAVADPSLSQRITPRDMVTHRTGMPRHDLSWYNNNEGTRAELFDRLEHLELTADLRQRFQYNNLMYVTAGYLTEQLTDSTWEAAVRTRLFEPLGMRRSNFSVSDSLSDANHAKPYREVDDELEEIPFRSIDLIGPAGSVNSSVNEMARWLLFNLEGGVIDGQRLIQRATLEDLHSAQIAVPSSQTRDGIVPVGYAMGWFVNVYNGHRMLSHGGGIDGFITSVMLFPEDGLGIVAFTNSASSLGNLVARAAADRILGLDRQDRIGQALAQRERARAIQDEAEERRDAQRVEGTTPSHALAEYPGLYSHPGYGELTIARADSDSASGLTVTYNGIEAPLQHWHYNVWSGAETVGDKTFENMKFAFRSNFEGVIDSIVVPMEPTASPIEFEKQPDPKLRDPEYLQRFVGVYADSVSEQTERVTLSGNHLQLAIPGQPVYTLEPRVDGRFSIGELQGFAVGFDVDETGDVVSITFYQPNGVFTSERIED
ncbi:MAG: serine hydrolase [Wenzhouxiangella sp.]|jgi:CubicO group peptidase (beta-lactamase class C family)|nr:serine hydrolase [Wenzhouxiangella sp.]